VDKILLSGLEFFGRHGCHAAERELGQRFLIDIELECDLNAAGQSDSLDDTIDYVAVLQAAREIVEGESAQLLEHLGARIADAALRDRRVQRARVRLRKPHVAMPVPLEYLGVEIVREQNSVPPRFADERTEYV
jgi:dihydroneopterin aldolase